MPLVAPEEKSKAVESAAAESENLEMAHNRVTEVSEEEEKPQRGFGFITPSGAQT